MTDYEPPARIGFRETLRWFGSDLMEARPEYALDLDGQLTHDGVAGERSDLCDLRPVVMAAPGFGDTAMTQASAIMHVLKDGLVNIFARCLLTAPYLLIHASCIENSVTVSGVVMGTETDEFLAEMLPRHHAAELSFRNGDAGPRLALWSRAEPVSWLGQYGGCVTGAAEVTEHFHRVASRFTDVREFRFELIAADVHGDAAYSVGFEHFLGSFDGRPDTVMTHRVSRAYRRENGDWRIAHGHGDVAPWVTRRPPRT